MRNNIKISNIFKLWIVSIIFISLIGYDCCNILRDNFDKNEMVLQKSDTSYYWKQNVFVTVIENTLVPSDEPQLSAIVYYLCDAICWTVFASLLYFITTQYFDNFLWTKRWAFILLGLSIYNLIDECLQDNLMPHYSEWFFAIIWIACTLKYIKNKPSPTNVSF
jgi:hypothetical protein